jgi:hypothetical protein
MNVNTDKKSLAGNRWLEIILKPPIGWKSFIFSQSENSVVFDQ